MKPYLLVTGTIFGLAGGMHLYALLRGWRAATSDIEFVIENGVLCVIGLVLEFWAYRLAQTLNTAG